MSFRVYMDGHVQQMDTSQRSMHGEFATHGEAVECARELVDAALEELAQPGMSADELLGAFATRGEMPFIMPDEQHMRFDPKHYARGQSEALCARGLSRQ